MKCSRALVLCFVSLLGLSECLRVTGPSLTAAVRCASRGGLTSVQLIAEQRANAEEALLLENEQLRQKVLMLEDTIERTEGLCEPLMGGGWAESLQSRATWLLGLLVAQSCSSFVLQDNEQLLTSHPTVIFFMTMLVGAGGNAGNQASVRLIRGLATGEITGSREQTMKIFGNEARVGLSLACILVAAGFVRVWVFQAPAVDAAAISASLFLIVTSSVLLGTALPLCLNKLRIDAAHASTSIQVIMDVLGVIITCTVAPVIFASFGV